MEENELFRPPAEEQPILPLDESKLNPLVNPLNNYNPGYGKNGSAVNSIINNMQQQLSSVSTNDMLQPVAYDPVASNRDRYINSDYFAELGFDPFRNNEELYGQRQTRMNKLANAFSGMGSLAYDQFVEQATSWGDTFNVMGDMAGLDFSLKDAFQAAEMEEITKRQNELFNANPIFETQADREGVWNFNTIANTMQQSGYAIGALAEVAAEEAALSALTTLTFGATSEIQAARTIKLAANIGKVARRTAELTEAAQKASTLRKIWNGLGTAAEFAGRNLAPLGNTIDFAKGFQTLRRADEIAMGGTKAALRTTARGFGAFYRDVRELNLAISEAKAEAAGTYSEMQTKLEERFKAENGREPDEMEKEALKADALKAAQTNGAVNTYLILLSNKIAFGSILKGFAPLRYMLDDDIAKGLIMLGEKDAAKMGKKFIEAADNRWLAFKNTLLKHPVKYLEANLAEALQENAQDMSNQAVQEWYLNKDKSHELDAAFTAFGNAAANQFTVQGAKTFISGFLTGSILGAGSKLFEQAGNISEYVTNREGYDKRRADEVNRRASLKNTLNSIYENPLAFSFNPKEGVTMQANFASLLKQAAADKDKKFFHDIQDDAMRHMILTGINSGTLDVLLDRMNDYVKNLSDEEFTQAFGVEYTKENHANMMEQVNRFKQKADNVSKIYNKLHTEFVNPFNPAQYQANTPEFMDEAIKYMGFREALNQMAFMQDTYQSAIVRQQQVLDGIRTKQGFENLPFTALYSLTSYGELAKEIALLEIELKSELTPELAAEKNKRLKKLTRYQKALDTYLGKVDSAKADKNLTPEQTEKILSAALEQFKKQGNPLFLEYVNEELKKAGHNPVQASVAAEAFDNLTDYFQLQDDHDAVLEHINILADPEAFSEYLNRHYKGYREFHQKRAGEAAAKEETPTNEPKDTTEPDPDAEDIKRNTDNPPTQEQQNGSETEIDDPETSKPIFGQTFFFKTIGVHFTRDGRVNKENGSNRFFRFTERFKFEPDTYFLMPVTATNDEFGIRRADKFPDDIKLVVVKKVGDTFSYVDQEGNVLENPTKDTIVYTSMVGNATLFGTDQDAAVKMVIDQFAVKDMTREQILGAIEAYKKEREEIKKAVANGETPALPITGRSRGIVVYAPKDINGVPQEIPLQGTIINANQDDFLNLEHPNGEEIELVIATVENAINMGNVDTGRMVARGKQTGNVFPIKSRKIRQEEINNIKEALKALTKLMGKNNLSADLNRQKKDILNYLSGVLFWGSPVKGKAISPNQFWVSKGQLNRGQESWKFDANTIEKNADAILGGLYFSVNNALLNKKGAFQAVKMNNGTAERESFDSYNAFLMSNEGGRTPILYTNVKPYNPDVNSEDFQIEGRYLLFNTSDEPVSSKIPAPGEKDTLASTPKPKTGGLQFRGKAKAPQPVQPVENPANPAPEQVKKGPSFAKKFGSNSTAATATPSTPVAQPTAPTTQTVAPETVTNATSSKAATPPAPAAGNPSSILNQDALNALLQNDIANTEDGSTPFQNEYYRLAVPGSTMKREDLAAVRMFLARVLPQIPLHIVGNLIHNKAYGAFMRGAIHLYENAEEGTGFHEAFEAVWNSYLTVAEQAQLAKEFSSRQGSFTNPFTGETKEYKNANMYDVREMLAEEFRDYMLKGATPKASPKTKSFFQKLLEFIKSILGLSKEDRAEMDSLVSDLFAKINDGGFVNAVPVRDLNNLDAVYRSIPGTTQEVTSYAVEGVTAYFFMNLYKDGKNTDALIKADLENNKELIRLFNAALEDMQKAIDAQFEAQFEITVKAYEAQVKRKVTPEERTALFNEVFVPNNRLFSQLDSIRQQPMELYQLFKSNMSRFGVGFADISEDMEIVPDETEADGLGITDAIKIDPRKFGSTNFKLLLGSLTDDVWNKAAGRYDFKKNLLGLPKLSNYNRIYAILLNELNGSMSRIEDGKFVAGIDTMFERLDKRFQKKDGKYKEGFEWIQRMKVRLKYINPRTGEKIPLNDLSADDVRLRVAFEQNLTNMQNDPVKMVFGEDGLIYNDASLDTASQNNKRAEWLNDVKAEALPFDKKDDQSLLAISDTGAITFDTRSAAYNYIMTANTFDTVLESLALLGVNFTGSNKALSLYESEIIDAFSAIRSKISDGTITTIDQMYGKTIVNGPIQTLLSVEIFTTPEENVLVHKNAEGENQYTITQPSTISYLISSLKAAKTLADFVRSNPQFGTVDSNGTVQLHAYQTNSLLLKPGGMFFDKNGKKRKGADIKYHLISGVTESRGKGKNTDVLTYADRVMQEINHLLGNVYYTIINSDKSTEFGLGLDEALVSFDDANIFASNSKVAKIYLDQLSDELDAAIEEHRNPSNVQYYSKEVKKLAHFRDILGPKFAADIKKAVETGNKSALISNPAVVATIMEYLEAEIQRTKQALLDMDMIYEIDETDGGGVVYGTAAMNAEFLRAYGIEDINNISEADMDHLMAFLVINKEVAVVEQHKLIYGHPALYKDLAKRSNGANSTKAAFIDNMEVRQWMDAKMPRMDGKVRSNEQSATFNVISFADNTVTARLMVDYIENMYKSMIELQKDKNAVEERIGAEFTAEGKFVKLKTDAKGKHYGDAAKYLEVNEADGQAWMMPDMYRDLLYMSSRMTHAQEAQWEYEKAYEIVARSSKPEDHVAYKAYSAQAIEDAKKVLAKGNPGAVLQVLKPQYFGYNANSPFMHTVFLKNSTQPKFYRQIENTAFEQLYLHAQDRKIDIIGLESGQKVGNMLNSEGEFTPIYDENGRLNILNENTPEVPVQTLLSRYMGIQQETPNVFKDAVVRGTQVTKLVMSNFKFRGKYTSPKAEELLTEYNDILTQLITLGKSKLVKELGVTEDAAGNYLVKDVSKMVQLLKKEAKSRDLPDNIVDAIDTIEVNGKKDFRYPLDALPNRDKIDNILNSIVNSRVISEKMSGKPAVQVASTLFETKGREFVYLKDGVWTSTKGVKLEDMTDEERATVRMTSNDLKFYELKDGKIQNMEVYLPNFLEGINLPGLKNGIISVKDIDPRILQALGFRIPTQGMNSIESITIKGFLPREMGDMVVVPTEITGKAGSDFDIDKLQMYLANFYVSKSGKATYYEWKGNQEDTRKYYEQLFDKGEFISEAEQAMLDEFITNSLYYNAQETITVFEGTKERIIFSKYFDADTLSREFLEEIKDRQARKNAVISAAVKKAMQNRYREVMQELVTLPENMRQLITPNSTDTLKNMADEINKLKGIEDLTSSSKYAIYRSLLDSTDIRHRFLSGKKLVGIAALQITSQVMAQLGEIKLTGKYNAEKLYYLIATNVKERLVKINLTHNTEENSEELFLDALTTQDGMLISDLINEALSGFVDAAKDPFVFSLNITLDTASTWFYLQKLGVPIKELAYFFNQPVLDRLFKERAKNRSIFKKVSDDKINDMAIAYKMSSRYYRVLFPEAKTSIYQDYINAKNSGDFKALAAVKARFFGMIAQARKEAGKPTEEQLRSAIERMNAKGYQLTKEDANMQLAIMADYLEYAQQASYMTNFITGIGYDNTKTKNITENVMQIGRWNKVKSDGFIANYQGIMDNTFMGKLQKEKEGIFDLFTPFFMSLDYRARKAFQPVLDLLDSGAFLMRDTQEELILKYNDFIINYIMQTTPFTNESGTTTTVGAHAERLLFGENSMAMRLKALKDSKDKNIQNNQFLKELLQVMATEKGTPHVVKMLKRVSDTYTSNILLDSAKDLYQYGMNSGNNQLVSFLNDLAFLTIIQGGNQPSAFNLTRLLPVEIYSEATKVIVDGFKNNLDVQLDVKEVWKQFHQNNYKDDTIVPVARFYKSKGGFLEVGVDMDTAKRPYVKLVSKVKGLTPEMEEEYRRNRNYDKLYVYTIYERYKNDGEKVYFRPINKKGAGKMFTEVTSQSIQPSLVETNNTARENLYPENRAALEQVQPTEVQEIPEDILNTTFTSEEESNYQEFEYMNPEPQTPVGPKAEADKLPPIEQNFADGKGGRKMQPQFAGKSTMDLILSGDRTRTTRAKTDIARMIKDYGITKIEDLVGKVIRMTDLDGRVAYTKITAVNEFTQEYQDATWQKEGWEKSVTDKHVGDYPYAIEFELYDETAAPSTITRADQALRDQITTELPSVASENAKKHVAKEQVKTKVATQFIGEGKADSSTDRYKGLYAKYNLANTGKYDSTDVIFVASNGARGGAVAPVVNGQLQGKYKNIDLAIAAGAKFIMDTAAHLASGSYNTGEKALADYLSSKGYKRVEQTGLWQPAESASFESIEVGSFSVVRNSDGTYTVLGLGAEVFDEGVATREEAIEMAKIYDSQLPTQEEADAASSKKSAEKIAELPPMLDWDPFGPELSVNNQPDEQVPVVDGTPLPKKYELFPGVYANEGQRQAIDKIDGFLKGDQEQFLLKGRGGTGKTTIIQKAIASANIAKGSIIGATVSYEAKNVLQESMKGYKTATIAGLLGLVADYDKNGAMFFRERTADEENKFRSMGKKDPIEGAKLIIVDEASMVGDFIYAKILEKKRSDAKVIFMGDNAQIPPIDVENNADSPVWDLAEGGSFAELTERMRQSSESPILPVTDVFAENIERIQKNQPGFVNNPLVDRTTKMENGEGVMFTNDVNQVIDEYIKDYKNAAFTNGSVIVGARNATVDNFNMRIRERLFQDEAATSPYMPGDFVRVNTPHYASTGELIHENGLKGIVKEVKPVAVENVSDFELYKITIETQFTDSDGKKQPRMVTMTTVSPSDKAKLKNALAAKAKEAQKFARGTQESKRAWAKFYQFKQSIVDVGYGYAITSHKVQGSTYDSTYVLESDIMSFPGGMEQQNRMMYTAVSRPRKKLVIFNAAITAGQTGTGSTAFARKFPVRNVIEEKDKGC